MSRFWLLSILLAGCVVDVPSSDLDDEADPDDVSEVLPIIEAHADGGGTATADNDGDGIPDATEELLLRRYRPYYKFSQNGDGDDESYRPANPIDEIANAQLKIDVPNGGGNGDPISGCGRSGDQHLDPPEQLYTCRTDTSFNVTHAKTDYALNLANARYHGVDFAQAQAEATGLYGHVSPTTLNGHDAYLIEYWQFYAFNNQDISVLGLGSFGDHEGDWTAVQVWFDRDEHRLAKVRYLIHGKQATFDIKPSSPNCRDCMIDMTGDNFDPNPGNFFDDQAAYSNNQAQFYIDDRGFKHVVAYIERGAHETWPGAWGHASVKVAVLTFGLNSHNGKGPSYLVPDVQDRIFNMGEVDHPLTRAGRLIMQFDGFWGSTNTHEAGFWGPVRRSPVGPTLHCEWGWADGRHVSGCEH